MTPEEMLPAWMRAAEARALETAALPDDDGTLRRLSMKGRAGGVGVTLLYGPAERRGDGAAVMLTGSPGANLHALEARGSVRATREGRLVVRQDPAPTFRKVASWVGRGDPEVGDEEFDDVFLIDGGAALARAVLGPDARDALKDLARLRVPLVLTVEGDLATLSCERVTQADATLDAALRVLAAVCG